MNFKVLSARSERKEKPQIALLIKVSNEMLPANKNCKVVINFSEFIWDGRGNIALVPFARFSCQQHNKRYASLK